MRERENRDRAFLGSVIGIGLGCLILLGAQSCATKKASVEPRLYVGTNCAHKTFDSYFFTDKWGNIPDAEPKATGVHANFPTAWRACKT